MHFFRNKTTTANNGVATSTKHDFSGRSSKETEVEFYEEPPTFQRVREGIIVGHKPLRRLKKSSSSSSNISASTIDESNKFEKEVRKQSCGRRTLFINNGMFARSMFNLNLKPKMYAHNSFLSNIEESQITTRRLSTKSMKSTKNYNRKNRMTNEIDDDDLLYQVSDLQYIYSNSEDRFANNDDDGYYDAEEKEPGIEIENKEKKQSGTKNRLMMKYRVDCLKVQSKLSAIYRKGEKEMKSSILRVSTCSSYKHLQDETMELVAELVKNL